MVLSKEVKDSTHFWEKTVLGTFYGLNPKTVLMALKQNNLHRILYNNSLKKVAKKLGVYEKIVNLYWYLIWKISGRKLQTSLSGVKTVFETSSPQDVRSWQHKMEGEGPLLDDILRNIRDDDVFYDIGAQNGLFSVLVGNAFGGEVVAFEPHPVNVKLLRKNIELNDLDLNVEQVALSKVNTKKKLTYSEGGKSAINSSLANEVGEKAVEVEVRKGHDFIIEEDLQRPTIIKIDVEGFEKKVLEGLEKEIEDKKCRVVYIEIHEDLLKELESSPEEVYEFLKEKGYSITEIYDRNQSAIKAERK